MTCNVGTPTWVLAAWIAAGLLSLAGALTYAELTAMKPQAGGEYVFLRDAYGKLSSFLFGWMQMFIAKPGSQAAASMAFAIGLNDFIGGGKLADAVFLKTNALGFPIEISMIQIVALMMIVIFTTLNCASVTFSGQIATVLTGVKIALIVFVGVGAFIWVTGDFAHFSLVNNNGTCEGVSDSVRYGSANYSFIGGFAAAMLGALWGYDGWNNLTFVAGEVKDPHRNIPLAIIGSTILIILLYVFVHVGYFYVLDPTSVASVANTSSVAKVVVSAFFGGDPASLATGIAVAFFTVGLMLSSLGTLHTSILSGSRVPFAMANDGLMFKQMGRLSINRVPVTAPYHSGFLGMYLGPLRFVRHAHGLRDIRLMDILCARDDLALRFPSKVSEHGKAVSGVGLSCSTGNIFARRRLAIDKYNVDEPETIFHRHLPDYFGITGLLLLN